MSTQTRHNGQHGLDCRICVGINEQDAISFTADRLHISPEQAKVVRAAPALLRALQGIISLSGPSRSIYSEVPTAAIEDARIAVDKAIL